MKETLLPLLSSSAVYAQEANAFLVTWFPTIGTVGVLFALALLLRSQRKLTMLERMGKVGMSKSANSARVKKAIADAVVDAIENAIFKGDIHRDDAEYWYKKVANVWNIPDLLHRVKSERGYKRQLSLKQRLQKKFGKQKAPPKADNVVNIEEVLRENKIAAGFKKVQKIS